MNSFSFYEYGKSILIFGSIFFISNSPVAQPAQLAKHKSTKGPKGLRPVDVPYNLEETLPNLALYAQLMDDKEVLEKVISSYQSHLKWILPDGGMDAGWCSRQYKWTYYDSSTNGKRFPINVFLILYQGLKPFPDKYHWITRAMEE